jgi:hypothetical protein
MACQHPNGYGQWVIATANTGSTALTYELIFAAQVTFDVQVAGVNFFGTGVWSDSFTVHHNTTQLPPTAFSVASFTSLTPTANMYTFSVTAPCNGLTCNQLYTIALTGFQVRYFSPNTASTPITVIANSATPTGSGLVATLTTSSNMPVNSIASTAPFNIGFQVAAVNPTGVGYWSSMFSITLVVPNNAPGIPTLSTFTSYYSATTLTSILVSLGWTAPACIGTICSGAHVMAARSYSMQYNAGSGSVTTIDTGSVSQTLVINNLVVTNIAPAFFQVAAVNWVGTGLYSSPFLPLSTPNAPVTYALMLVKSRVAHRQFLIFF